MKTFEMFDHLNVYVLLELQEIQMIRKTLF